MASVLFYSGSTYSYISVKFYLGLDLICDILHALIYVSISIKKFAIVTYVYSACSVMFVGLSYLGRLVILDMVDFDVIFGMTWLFPCYVVLNSNVKIVTLEILGKDRLEWESVYISKPTETTFFIQDRSLMGRVVWPTWLIFGISCGVPFF